MDDLANTPVRIALIDSGVEDTAVNKASIVEGYNYCLNTNDTRDTIGHGTALASLIVGSEKAGIEGAAKEVLMVPMVCQQMNKDGQVETVDEMVLAQMILDAATKYHCRLINMSLGVKKDYPKMREAIETVLGMGVIVVASAGNEGTEEIYYPAGYSGVLCIGAANSKKDGYASFSQHNDCVDLLAEGIDIPVATMKGNCIKVSGTSYATAFVTAKLANLCGKNPGLKREELFDLLFEESIEKDGIRFLL